MPLSNNYPSTEPAMLRPELMFVPLQAASRQEALAFLAERMLAAGLVMPGFPAALLEREEAFPTGLQFPEAALALPHTEIRYVLQPALAVAVLSKPVAFLAMGAPEQSLAVRVIFLPAVLHPDAQVRWLSGLITLFQTPGFLSNLLGCADRENLYRYLRVSLDAVPL